jgi:hypothetical protein
MTDEAIDKRKRQLSQHAYVKIDHLQLFFIVERTGSAYETETCIVDDELRLAPCAVSASLISCATPASRRSATITIEPARGCRRNLVSQRT